MDKEFGGTQKMKYLILISFLFIGGWAQAGGMALVTQGRLVSKSKTHIVFETSNLRYRIKVPKHPSRNQPFELKRVSGNFYTLSADVSLIVSKKYVKR